MSIANALILGGFLLTFIATIATVVLVIYMKREIKKQDSEQKPPH